MTDIVPTPATDNQTAAKMPKSTSPLLNLPPELRNTIYRYALQRPSGVDPKKPGSPSVWHSSHQVSSFWSFNQLKYTCRQLRNETSALASLCNELWFESWSQINQFLSRYPAESYGDLQTLHVRHDHKIFVPKLRAGVKYPHGVFSIQEIDVILEVASKCLQHSDLMIHIHLAALSAEDDHFIEMILPQARIFGRKIGG